nr:uncharacterized protein LOC117687155 [Crassostrea gigas]
MSETPDKGRYFGAHVPMLIAYQFSLYNKVIDFGTKGNSKKPSSRIYQRQFSVVSKKILSKKYSWIQNKASYPNNSENRMVHGGIAPRPIGERGSGAARALARSGQSNAPDTCALLNDRSEKLSQASRTIAANPEIGSFQRAVSDPQILQSFERACRSYCYEMPKCDFSDPYRRTDGQCNNPINPLLGSSFTPQQRVVPNAYDNLIDAPRTRSVDNTPPAQCPDRQ